MLFQSIPTRGGDALYPFVICGQTYIAAINHHDGEKNVERLSTTSDMRTSPLETTLSHTEKFLPKRRWFDSCNNIRFPKSTFFICYYSETENKYRLNSNMKGHPLGLFSVK